MAYPNEMLWGAGYTRFYLGGLGDNDGGTVNLSTAISAMVVPREERYDGGAVRVALADGTVRNRMDGYRLEVTLTAKALTAAEVSALVRVINYAARGGRIMMQPHNEVNITFAVNPPQDVDIQHTGELYVGHDLNLTFTSEGLIKQLPMSTGNSVLPPQLGILGIFNVVG